MNEQLKKQGRLLEEEFFARQDAVLLQKLKELERMEHTQKALSEVSGITNPSILKRLAELDIQPECLASLAVLPLVEVAWADGEVQEKERKAILDGTAGAGFGRGTVDYALVEEWLKHRPPRSLLDAWEQCVRGLCESLTPEERAALKRDLMSRARAVADAAGGFLGLTKRISAAEEAILAEMEASFGETAP